jgi:hypothetical protein
MQLLSRSTTLALATIYLSSSTLAAHIGSWAPGDISFCKPHIPDGSERNSTLAFGTATGYNYATQKTYKSRPIIKADFAVGSGLTLAAFGTVSYVLGVEYKDKTGPKDTKYFEPSETEASCLVKDSRKWTSLDGIHLMEVKQKPLNESSSSGSSGNDVM